MRCSLCLLVLWSAHVAFARPGDFEPDRVRKTAASSASSPARFESPRISSLRWNNPLDISLRHPDKALRPPAYIRLSPELKKAWKLYAHAHGKAMGVRRHLWRLGHKMNWRAGLRACRKAWNQKKPDKRIKRACKPWNEFRRAYRFEKQSRGRNIAPALKSALKILQAMPPAAREHAYEELLSEVLRLLEVVGADNVVDAGQSRKNLYAYLAIRRNESDAEAHRRLVECYDALLWWYNLVPYSEKNWEEQNKLLLQRGIHRVRFIELKYGSGSHRLKEFLNR